MTTTHFINNQPVVDSARVVRRVENRFAQPIPKNRVTLNVHCQENLRATISLQVWDERGFPSGFTLTVHDQDGELVDTIELEKGDWTNLGGHVLGEWARSTWVAHHTFVRPFQGEKVLAVHAVRGGEIIASAAYEPYPLIFPSADEKPYVVFAGSCFDIERAGYKNSDEVNADIEMFRAAIENASRSPERLRPGLAVLLGDQVYLDQPVSYWRTRNSMRWLWNTFLRKYERSWTALDQVMANAMCVCLTDDHEYWNDYPNTPVRWGWPALRNPRYRRDVRNLTEGCADSLQLAEAHRELVSLRGVNFEFLETRRWRETRSRRFCSDVTLNRVVRRLREARVPTVLVLGQPAFSQPTSTLFGGLVLGDRLLPSHRRQFERLAEAINESPHDVVILSGDSHFSRVAQALLPATDSARNEHKVIEVISSPLLGLRSAPSRFDASQARRDEFWPHGSIAAENRAKISYIASSSASKSNGDASINNAVYLSFNLGDEPKTVKMRVQSIDLERQASSSRSLAVDFSHEFLLR